jgi:hypothetical protein
MFLNVLTFTCIPLVVLGRGFDQHISLLAFHKLMDANGGSFSQDLQPEGQCSNFSRSYFFLGIYPWLLDGPHLASVLEQNKEEWNMQQLKPQKQQHQQPPRCSLGARGQ